MDVLTEPKEWLGVCFLKHEVASNWMALLVPKLIVGISDTRINPCRVQLPFSRIFQPNLLGVISRGLGWESRAEEGGSETQSPVPWRRSWVVGRRVDPRPAAQQQPGGCGLLSQEGPHQLLAPPPSPLPEAAHLLELGIPHRVIDRLVGHLSVLSLVSYTCYHPVFHSNPGEVRYNFGVTCGRSSTQTSIHPRN